MDLFRETSLETIDKIVNEFSHNVMLSNGFLYITINCKKANSSGKKTAFPPFQNISCGAFKFAPASIKALT